MSDLLPPLSVGATVFLWLAVCVAVPREFMRKSMVQHYRAWVKTRAYWGRSCDKWIVGDRVFYTDELWSDLFSSLFLGILPSVAFAVFGSTFGLGSVELPIALAATLSTPPVLFAARIFDRCQIADDEVSRLQAIDPAFSATAEIGRLLADPKHVRRVVGRHGKTNHSHGG